MDRHTDCAHHSKGSRVIQRPRANRVTPLGTIEATPHRGTLLGNRGDLHAADGTIQRLWRSKRWISCTLTPRGGEKLSFDRPGQYTPLFFLDEAVALAAGHRPCASCRRDAFGRFVSAWKKAHSLPPDSFLSAADIDAQLHKARLAAGVQRTYPSRLHLLPDRTFVSLSEQPSTALLYSGGHLHPWRHGGYGKPIVVTRDIPVMVRTPALLMKVLSAGYQPAIALSAQGCVPSTVRKPAS